ncbi:MAG: amidohydrolase family protein, partial [Pirellulaceae bacterium]|nr:amidohydrolase family protein [Pirellulaceae bacterium]
MRTKPGLKALRLLSVTYGVALLLTMAAIGGSPHGSLEECRASQPGSVPESAKVDLILQGGTIIDGSGQPRRRADVAIKGARIVALGDLGNTRAKRIIDASGKIICPGFIDRHSHADRGILSYRDAENYIRQGVTTLVCGNCGSSPTDVAAFFKDLRRDGIGPNLALLIGHGSIRQQVMGRINAPPSPEQLLKMQ